MRKKSSQQFKDEMYIINPNIEILEQYKTNRIKIKCKCKLHNFIWLASPKSLLRSRGCPICANNIKKTTSQFIQEFNNIDSNVQILGEYKGAHKKIKCQCKIDNNIWYPTPHNLLKGTRCPECSRNISKGELVIKNILEQNNIKYNREYKVFINNHIHYFDFYISNKNIFIEYDGGQHYFPVDFSGQGFQNAQNKFYKQQIKDGEKDMWCFINGYELIRIPYTMSDENIEKIIGEL